MKISEYLTENPALDFDVEFKDRMVLDVVCVFRTLGPEQAMGNGSFYIATSEHTDSIVATGLLHSALDVGDTTTWAEIDEDTD